MFRTLAFVAAASLIAIPALADTADAPIATGGTVPAVAPSTTSAPPLTAHDQVDEDDGGQQIVMGACGPTHATPDGKPDTAAHGEVEAGIGTGGYRHLAGTVCKPIGTDGAVSLSIGTTSFNGGGWRR